MTNNLFYHRGSFGDMVYSIPTIRSFGGGTLCVKDKHYNFVKSFFESQSCVEKVVPLSEVNWNDITYNLDRFRPVHRQDVHKHLIHCHLDAFGMKYDIRSKWIDWDVVSSEIVVINRTSRYHDRGDLDWNFLSNYKENYIFVGSDKEYQSFKRMVNFSIEYVRCETMSDVCNVVSRAKLFIGNQSMAYALAEGLKVPRVLETCHEKNNCRLEGSVNYLGETIQSAFS